MLESHEDSFESSVSGTNPIDRGRGMETEAKDPFVARLEPEKVIYLEQEGWSSSLDGTQLTKMWDDGSQSEIDFEHVRDWSLRVLKEVLTSFPLHKVTRGLKK